MSSRHSSRERTRAVDAQPILSVRDLQAHLPHALLRREPRREGRRRHQLRRPAQRDLRARRRVQLRQDDADQDHRRRGQAAARGRRRQRGLRFPARLRRSCTAHPRRRWRGIRWRHLSYIMQGSMNVLNPLRRVRSRFRRLRVSGTSAAAGRPSSSRSSPIWRGSSSTPRCWPPIRTSCPAACANASRIALATICRPDFIIADEPTTALDVLVQKDVLGMIRGIQREIGSSVLFVTHDMGVHAHLTDRLGIMYAGRLVEEAATAEIFARSAAPLYASILSPACPASAMTRPARDWKAPRRTSPIRRRAAASIRAARWRWRSAGARSRP